MCELIEEVSGIHDKLVSCVVNRLPTNWKGQDEGAIIKPPAHQVVECLPGGFPLIPRSRHVQLGTELILQANEDSDDEVALEACDSGLCSVNMVNSTCQFLFLHPIGAHF